MSQEMELNIRTPKDTKKITISQEATVSDLRKNVSEIFSAEEERLCLIFSGKILKNEDTLEQHGIKNGVTIHLVIKSVAASTTSEAHPSFNTTNRPANTNPSTMPDPSNGNARPGLAGLTNLLNSVNSGQESGMGNLQADAQRALLQNPELMSNMMQNPVVSAMLDNPETMMSLIQADPNMRQMMENNPEMRSVLSNPSTLRQISEVARNPAMMQEMMRNYDRAVSNIEAIPGGFNHLERLYHDVQEPMINASSGPGGVNPFRDLRTTVVPDQTEGSSDPVPNPWDTSANAGEQRPTTRAGETARPTPAMAGDPMGMLNLMNNDYMQNALGQLVENPEFLRTALASSDPTMASNPELLNAALPHLMAQVNNPETRSALTNPRVIEALNQIRQGMDTLRTEAPSLLAGMYHGAGPHPASNVAAAADPTTGGNATPGAGAITPEMMNMMAGLLASNRNNTVSQRPPEEQYASQIQQLESMGFTNRQANINALVATFGDVNAAIDRILSTQF